MSADALVTSSYCGLDLFTGAGPSAERCVAAIGAVLGLDRTQFVEGKDFDALIAAIERATIGWVVCHRSEHPDYPHRFDVNLIDGRSPIDAVPDIVQRLGVAVIVPNNETDDPYAGLRFDPGRTVRSFSLTAFDTDEEG